MLRRRPSLALIFLLTLRRLPPDASVDAVALDVVLPVVLPAELVESIRRRIPGCVCSSITCCGVPWYRYACDFNWKRRYRT